MKLVRTAEAALLAAFAISLSLSIAAMEVTFLAALLLRLWRHLRGERWSLAPRALLAATAALVATWTACGLLAPEPWESVRWVLRLYQVLVVFLISEHASRPEGARRLVMACALGILAGTGYGLFEWWREGASLDRRLEGGFSTAMTSGNVLASSWAAMVGLLATAGGPAGSGAALFAVAAAAIAAPIALAAAATRSSWLGAVVASAVIGVRANRRWVAVAALAVAVGLSLAVPLWRSRAAPSGTAAPDYTAQGRVSLWKSGWELFGERPITGYGLADHGERIAAHRRPDATFVAGHFHSNPVQVLVSTGIAGTIAYIAFHLTLLWSLWRRRGAMVTAALGVWTAFHVAGFFDWSFGDAEVTYNFFFWMGLGLSGAACVVDRPESDR